MVCPVQSCSHPHLVICQSLVGGEGQWVPVHDHVAAEWVAASSLALLVVMGTRCPPLAPPTDPEPPPAPPPLQHPRNVINYPQLQPLPPDFLTTMEEYVKEAPKPGEAGARRAVRGGTGGGGGWQRVEGQRGGWLLGLPAVVVCVVING
jgi:hypothetical protein